MSYSSFGVELTSLNTIISGYIHFPEWRALSFFKADEKAGKGECEVHVVKVPDTHVLKLLS